MLDRFKAFWQGKMLAPFVNLFIRLGISPDVVTLVAFTWEPDEVVASWYSPELLFPKKGGPDEARRALSVAADVLSGIDEADFAADLLEERCREAAIEAGMKAGKFAAKKGLTALLAPIAGPAAPVIANVGVDLAASALDRKHDGNQGASSVYTGGNLNYFNA